MLLVKVITASFLLSWTVYFLTKNKSKERQMALTIRTFILSFVLLLVIMGYNAFLELDFSR